MAHAAPAIDISRENRRFDDIAPGLAGRVWTLGVGAFVVAILMALIPTFTGKQTDFSVGASAFFRSYVLAFAYACSLGLGALFFTMIQHLTRAGWSVVVRRFAETIAGQLPLLALLGLPLLIPIIFGMEGVYEWSSAAAVKNDATGLLQKKQPYLNATFFIIRMVFYFAVWGWLGSFYLNKSVEQDLTGDHELSVKMGGVAGPGVLLYALTVTFFAVDLLMSLTPHWYSTIFGVYYFAGCMVSTHATLIVMMVLLQRSGRLVNVLTQEHYQDVGKFMFAFTVFWAYIGFSQYMLIWYANLPEETYWYAARQSTPYWLVVSLTLLFGHFVLPFLALISKHAKRSPNFIFLGACWMLLMHFVDMHYVVSPDTHGYQQYLLAKDAGKAAAGAGSYMAHGATALLTDIPMTIGMLAVLASAVIRELGRNSLIPERDPRLNESLAFENI